MIEVQSLILVVIITIAASFTIMVLGANLSRLFNVAASFYNKARDVIFDGTGRR